MYARNGTRLFTTPMSLVGDSELVAAVRPGRLPLRAVYPVPACDGGRVRLDEATHTYTAEGRAYWGSVSAFVKLGREPFDAEAVSLRMARGDPAEAAGIRGRWATVRDAGTLAHALMERFVEGHAPLRPGQREREGFDATTPNADVLEQHEADAAIAQCRAFLREQAAEGYYPLRTELPLATQSDPALCGTVDLLMWHPGTRHMRIVDWKTCASDSIYRGPSSARATGWRERKYGRGKGADYALQVHCYATMLHHHTPGGVRLGAYERARTDDWPELPEGNGDDVWDTAFVHIRMRAGELGHEVYPERPPVELLALSARMLTEIDACALSPDTGNGRCGGGSEGAV